jgi:hypothetical protein
MDGLRPSVIDPGTPEFTAEIVGVAELHAAFSKESRTRGPRWSSLEEIQVRICEPAAPLRLGCKLPFVSVAALVDYLQAELDDARREGAGDLAGVLAQGPTADAAERYGSARTVYTGGCSLRSANDAPDVAGAVSW